VKRALILLLAITSATAAFADDLDFSTLRYLVVYKDVRKKPLDTVAIETLQKISGKRAFVDPESGRKMEPMDVLLSMWLETRDWSQTPVVLLTYQPLKEQLGLPVDQSLFSYKQLATPKLKEILTRVQQKENRDQDLTRDEREAKVLGQRLSALSDVVGPDTLEVVPPPSAKDKWAAVTQVADHYGAQKQAEVQKAFQAMATGYVQRDPETFAVASRDLSKLLRALNPALYPSFDNLRREVRYNSFHLFRKAIALYAFAFIWMLATWRARNPGFYWAGVAAFAGGLAVHAYAFYLRIMISGRPPVTNMYESVVWVSCIAALFALTLELAYRQRYYIVGVAPLSIVLLILADQFPAVLDSSIGPLTPVLRDNFWLSVHVPTITAGYAAFFVTLGVGHIALGYYICAPQAKATIARLETLVYRAMQIGVLLIAAGTILGGIWAHYAWGRFWGWDPKEVWALITLLCYLIPLHGRVAGWLSDFALSVASVVCFLPVLMAWYGVNFVLGKGLHSYGFGVGGYWYALAFVAVELAFVGVAAWRRRRVNLTAESGIVGRVTA